MAAQLWYVILEPFMANMYEATAPCLALAISDEGSGFLQDHNHNTMTSVSIAGWDGKSYYQPQEARQSACHQRPRDRNSTSVPPQGY